MITADDLRVLIEYEDELTRCGNFVCIFPNLESHKYFKFFETIRYYNILLQEWINNFHKNKNKGKKLILLVLKSPNFTSISTDNLA